MKPQKTKKSLIKKPNRNTNFDFLLELSDDELDLLAGGKTTFYTGERGFSQPF